MDRPKGFAQYGNSVQPIKQGSMWSAGVWNGGLGYAMASTKQTRYQGWLVCKNTPYIGTGKDLKFDFAMFSSPRYFDYTGENAQKICMYIKFYSMIDQKFDDNWTHITDYSIGKHGGSLPDASNNYGADGPITNAARYVYDTYYNCYTNAKKPAYGVTVTSEVPLQSTYKEYVDACIGVGATPSTWDAYNNNSVIRAFVNPMPFGVRYISHNGNWGPKKLHVDFAGTVKSNGQYISASRWSQQQEDCGSAGDLKSLLINEELIKRAHGKVAGVTAFKLRFTFHTSDVNGVKNIPNEWLWPENEASPYAKLDNPQVGLLDYGPAGAPAGWPPRFDAKAVQLVGGGRRVDLQAKYAPPGGGWGIF